MQDPFAKHVVVDMRDRTKGLKVPLDFGGRKRCTFQMGKPKSYEADEGIFMLSGEIVTASGHRFHALLEISALDSGEHSGTGVAYTSPEGEPQLAFQGEPGFKELVATIQAEDPSFRMFPYAYHYYMPLMTHDHHVDDQTGWSDNWESLQRRAAQMDKTSTDTPGMSPQ